MRGDRRTRRLGRRATGTVLAEWEVRKGHKRRGFCPVLNAGSTGILSVTRPIILVRRGVAIRIDKNPCPDRFIARNRTGATGTSEPLAASRSRQRLTVPTEVID